MVISTFSVTLMLLLVTTLEVTLMDHASQAAINPCKSLMSDKMPRPERMKFLECSGMFGVISYLSFLLIARLWCRHWPGSPGTREQLSMVMPLICHDNGLRHSEWEERDWAQEGRDTESKHGYEIETDRTSLGRPEPHNDPDWLLPWDTGPRGHGPLNNTQPMIGG